MTQSDKNKLFQCISADFKIVARKTEIWKMNYCEEVLHDIALFLEQDYLSMIHLIMKDQYGNAIRCNKYIIKSASAGIGDKPGAIDWDGIDGTDLNVVLSYTQNWHGLTDYQRSEFERALTIPWYASYEPLSFPTLNHTAGKNFSASDFSIQREDLK